MVRVFKQLDYYMLVCYLYKITNYDRKKAKILYKYTMFQLFKNGFNEIYRDKLAYDLNLVHDNETEVTLNFTEQEYKRTLNELNELLNHYELINLKSKIWDIIHKGYHD